VIHVAITCPKGCYVGRPPCDEYFADLAPDRVEQWVEATLREHGWHVDEHDAYWCSRHNPTDAGLVVEIGPQRAYTPLGESGWEARAEERGGPAEIEIRPRRDTLPAGNGSGDDD
jgi:hypothetical protein